MAFYRCKECGREFFGTVEKLLEKVHAHGIRIMGNIFRRGR
ncbi:MAG: hypothetical protein ABEJ99_04615 [Candidatus Nanohaloarchaea archaeon]